MRVTVINNRSPSSILAIVNRESATTLKLHQLCWIAGDLINLIGGNDVTGPDVAAAGWLTWLL